MAKLKLQDFVEYGGLFSLYGTLLTGDRQQIMADYFEFNMTLAEIAKERNVSRQAVLDAIEKSCQKLTDFEAALHLQEKNQNLLKALDEIKKLSDDKIVAEKVEKLLKEI